MSDQLLMKVTFYNKKGSSTFNISIPNTANGKVLKDTITAKLKEFARTAGVNYNITNSDYDLFVLFDDGDGLGKQWKEAIGDDTNLPNLIKKYGSPLPLAISKIYDVWNFNVTKAGGMKRRKKSRNIKKRKKSNTKKYKRRKKNKRKTRRKRKSRK